MGAYLVAVAGLVAAVSVMRALELGAGTGASEGLVLVLVVLTLPLSTAYYVVGSLGSSQGSGAGGFAVGALSMSAALYYLGFFVLAAIDAAVFRWIFLSTRRRRRRLNRRARTRGDRASQRPGKDQTTNEASDGHWKRHQSGKMREQRIVEH